MSITHVHCTCPLHMSHTGISIFGEEAADDDGIDEDDEDVRAKCQHYLRPTLPTMRMIAMNVPTLPETNIITYDDVRANTT